MAMVMAMIVIISGRCNTALNQTASYGRLNTQCMASCPVLGLFISSDSCGLCRKQSHIQFFGQKWAPKSQLFPTVYSTIKGDSYKCNVFVTIFIIRSLVDLPGGVEVRGTKFKIYGLFLSSWLFDDFGHFSPQVTVHYNYMLDDCPLWYSQVQIFLQAFCAKTKKKDFLTAI